MTVMAQKKKSRDQGARPPFIRALRIVMAHHDIDNPTELYNLLVERGEAENKFSKSVIYQYFSDESTPQPWFVRALARAIPLSEEEEIRLKRAYFESY